LKTENSVEAFEDVKEELFTMVYEEKIYEHYMNYLEELHHKYNVQYLYTSLG
jgi:hypothetical protein